MKCFKKLDKTLGVEDEDQPCFHKVDNCYFAKTVGDENRGYIRKTTERNDSVKEDGDELRYLVIRHYAAAVETEIEEGCFCTVETDKDDSKQGYNLLQYTGTDVVYTDQDTGKCMCQGIYWYAIDDNSSDNDDDDTNDDYDDDNDDTETELWFFPLKSLVDTVSVDQIVMRNVVKEAVNDKNCPINEVKEDYLGKRGN